VRHSLTVSKSFDAGHQVVDDAICSWGGHGHRWTVSVTVTGGLDPKTIMVVDHAELVGALDSIILELQGHNLNDMLPGVVTTPEGIGLYFRERLILDWPTISQIRVETSIGITAVLEN